MKCTLCSSSTEPFYFYEKEDRHYHRCTNCRAVLMDPEDYPTPNEEVERYESHDNDVEDPRYQAFVSPLVERITQHFEPDSLGLDYGSGTGPVITKLLTDQGYSVNTFDPFFDNTPEVLELKYDYIVSCEVMEHFHEPYQEFEQLKKMLKPEGALFLKTDPYTDDKDFHAWYYKSDETHVIFYHPVTMQWIKEEFCFSKLDMDDRHISLFL
ncbi:class I SAM-dependent methyltransferase [Gracilimonas mengyeensis]|uniref:Methyltransferase domain-containing protein n=1 Tax=Gracilimonas mengyeensis TaxID=1302730 RepID=A0A521DUZ2_9BACT|nr:class I SAM-dependent methyltransferase [Gracilimonas mengyeensis]SMO75517.1 Methyltransferase domain-containing protein [Gracilimonas mengyeensis]